MRLTKYLLSVLLLAAIILPSCRKRSNASGAPTNAEYFIFGRVSGFCPGQCAQYYKITGNMLYKSYFDSVGQLKYSAIAMPSSKYAIASPALTNFPAYLSSRPNVDIKCPNCADMPYIRFEYKQGSQVYEWSIDYPYDGIPTEIRPYMDQVNKILDDLE